MKLVYTKQIKNPRRWQANIEFETWKKLRYLAMERAEETGNIRHGIGVLVEEALQAWLPGEERKGLIKEAPARIRDPRRIQVMIGGETYRRLRHIAVDRNLPAVGLLLQGALDMWFLEREREK